MARKITVRHIYNQKDQPIMTVASVDTEDAVATGLAICSKNDMFNGKRGRKIALGRAFKALQLKQDRGVITRVEAVDRLDEIGILFNHKMFYTQKTL